MSKTAVLHVENTENIIDFAEFLSESGWRILTANKTENLLRKQKLQVYREASLLENKFYLTDSSELVNKILRTQYDSQKTITEQSENKAEDNIFIVCMNLYPQINNSEKNQQLSYIAKPVNYYISTILRSAYLNYENVLILTDPVDYKEAMIQLKTDSITPQFRLYLAAKALNLVSAFDAGIATSILQSSHINQTFMNYLSLPYHRALALHQGANAQQKAYLYKLPTDTGALNALLRLPSHNLDYGIVTDISIAWEQISSLFSNLKSQLSVNTTNCDGYDFTTQFTPLTGTVFTVAIKNKCILGASLGSSISESLRKTYTFDLTNTHEVSIGCSSVVDEEADIQLIEWDIIAIIAPGYTSEAKALLSRNKNIRLISSSQISVSTFEGRLINGGLVLQNQDTELFSHWSIKTKNRPSQLQTDQMAFGMNLVKDATSYSAVLLKNYRVVGFSKGNSSCARAMDLVLAEAQQTQERIKDWGIDNNSENVINQDSIADILVCDYKIPFCEGIKKIIDSGVSAILQTGGTTDDKEFINYCDERGIVMVFTGITHLSYN